MTQYELVMILEPNLGEEKHSQFITRVEDKLKSFGATLTKTDKWGNKKLANVFKKNNKMQQGYYVLVFFEAETSVPAKIQSFLKVSEGVVRYSVYKSLIKKEEQLAEIAGVPLANKAAIATPAEIPKAQGEAPVGKP